MADTRDVGLEANFGRTTNGNSMQAPNIPIFQSMRTPVSKQGWKLHLNFDPTNPDTVFAVQECLQTLQVDEEIYGYKIGQGGGIEAGQPGKEATVYIGSYDQMMKVAHLVDHQIGTILLEHDPNVVDCLAKKLGHEPDSNIDGHPTFGLDTWQDDIVVLEDSLNYFARFDIWPNPIFSEYGINGIPLIDGISREIKAQTLFGGTTELNMQGALEQSVAKLSDIYGEFFLTEEGHSWLSEMQVKQKDLIANHIRKPASSEITDKVVNANKEASILRSSSNSQSRYGRLFEHGRPQRFDFR